MEENVFITRDLQMAATLAAIGHKPIRLDNHQTKPHTKLFVFRNKSKLKHTAEQDALEYNKRNLKVEPNLLFHYNNTLREWVTNELKAER